ncbi:MAG: alpha/beta hydrolase [Candidatus Woesearchaeota archaeon]
MADVFIIHGTLGYPGENWFPWLKQEIEKLGHKCHVPQFPTPENQKLDTWLEVFNKYLLQINSKTILIGHSCGAIFLLRLLERINTKVKAVFLVAGPIKPLNNQFDKYHMSFLDYPIDWKKVKSNAQHFYPIYSENDPYVGPEHGRITAKQLNTKLIMFNNAGHFNEKAGYLKFEFLLDLVKKELE